MKYRIYRLDYGDGHNMGYHTWELEPSLRMALKNFPQAPDRKDLGAWEYVQIVPMSSWNEYYCGNDGAQGWRHKKSGYTVPDYCRQTGGHPEVWTHTKRKQLTIREGSPVLDYIVYL